MVGENPHLLETKFLSHGLKSDVCSCKDRRYLQEEHPNIPAEAIKKPRLFIRFASIYPADWMQVFLYSLFIARWAENNTAREERDRIPHDDIWNQKCFTGSTESGPDMFPTWNRTKWSSRYTTCSISVFQHTLDNSFVASSKFTGEHSNERKTTKSRR